MPTQTDPRPREESSSPDRIDATYDDFSQIDHIGSGGNADVTKESYDGPGPDVIALKQPQIQGTMDTEAVSEFTNEAETWAKIDDHPNIVGVLDWDSEPFPWIALEYMDGGSLADRLGNLDPAEALWIGVSVTKAVRHAHRRGVAHLDLKPENIMFATTPGDSWDVPKVADWGLAKMLLEHSKSVEQISFHYAAPEQFDSETFGQPEDLTDIYAIGAVVYAGLVGEPPFPGPMSSVVAGATSEEVDAPSDHVDGLPEGTDAVIKRALAKEKDDRYESALDLRRDLETLVERTLGDGDEGSLIAQGGTPTIDQPTTSTASQSATTTDDSAESILNRDQKPSQPSSEPEQSSEPAGDTSVTEPVGADSEGVSDLPNYHYYMIASAVMLWLGAGISGPNSGPVPGLLVLAGVVGFYYFYNADLKNIQTNPEIDWYPVRLVYLIGSIIGVPVLYYYYKRYAAVKKAKVDRQG